MGGSCVFLYGAEGFQRALREASPQWGVAFGKAVSNVE